MRLAVLGMRPHRSVAAGVLGALLLGTLAAGCGEGAPPARATGSLPTSPSPSPSLPPGDPGLDAPAAPDPGGGAEASTHDHGEARRTVPVGALLTAGTVRMLLGGSWVRHEADGDECLGAEGAVGARTLAYAGPDGGVVTETVATYEDAEAADAAIAALGRSAEACGWVNGTDPRLGSASFAAEAGARSMIGVSAEGVMVVLVGEGDFTQDTARWGSVADLALGTSCAAAADGCH